MAGEPEMIPADLFCYTLAYKTGRCELLGLPYVTYCLQIEFLKEQTDSKADKLFVNRETILQEKIMMDAGSRPVDRT